MKRLLSIGILGLCLIPFLARAQTHPLGKIEADPVDVPVQISGWVGSEHILIGNLRLTAREAPVDHFLFFSSDLTRTSGDEIIPRQDVTLLGTAALTMTDVPKDFMVQVANIDAPGTYTGTLTFISSNQLQERLDVPVSVVAKVRPVLVALPGTERIQLQLVDCGVSVDCFLGQRLLPSSFFVDSFQLQFKNVPLIAVGINDAKVSVKGEQTGYQLTEKELYLSQPTQQVLPATSIVTLPLTIMRSAIPPDHYTGYLYLSLANGEEPLVVPVDLSVRSPPFWPLIALLLGILLGRAVKYMQERGNTVANKILTTQLLENTIRNDTLNAADERGFLLREVRNAQTLVYNRQLDDADKVLAKIEQVSALLKQVRASSALKPAEIAAVKRLIYAGRYDDARKLLQDFEQRVILGTARPSSESPSQMVDASQADAIVVLSPGATATATLPRVETTPANKDQRIPVQRESNTDPVVVGISPQQVWIWMKKGVSLVIRLPVYFVQFSTSATIWLRPALAVILLLALVIVGLNTIYVTNNIFGAHPLSDYLGLVLWGLSADVVSRNLSSLGSSPGSTVIRT
jgi:hypothetical protein